MPIYEYECRKCGEVIEAMQRVSDPPLATCAACGGDLKKLISAPAFQFKGSGWYVTDYAKKGAANGKGDGSREGESKKTAGEGSSTKTESASSGGSGSADKPAAS